MQRVDTIEFAEFDWDETKRQRVLAEREIDFLQAAEALLKPHLEQPSDKQGEVRILAICPLDTKLVAVVYTIRNETCRIVTARAARKNERRQYSSVFG